MACDLLDDSDIDEVEVVDCNLLDSSDDENVAVLALPSAEPCPIVATARDAPSTLSVCNKPRVGRTRAERFCMAMRSQAKFFTRSLAEQAAGLLERTGIKLAVRSAKCFQKFSVVLVVRGGDGKMNKKRLTMRTLARVGCLIRAGYSSPATVAQREASPVFSAPRTSQVYNTQKQHTDTVWVCWFCVLCIRASTLQGVP